MPLSTHRGTILDRPVSSEDRAGREDPGNDGPSLVVRLWGVRGSTPDPGSHSVRYGGNTSCVEIRAGEDRIILDAGTGIRNLGEHMLLSGGEKRATLLLTHFHWDHIQGLPFFRPIYDPAFCLQIRGPAQGDGGVEHLLAGQMTPPYFPVPYKELPGSLNVTGAREGTWMEGGVQVTAMRVHHPSVTLGYRMNFAGRSVVYVPDNDLGGDGPPDCDGWRDRFDAFVRDADVLLHDAMFTEAERPGVEAWGHSTFEQLVEMAGRNGVKTAFFFHHAPGRSDAELTELLERFCRQGAGGEDGTRFRLAAEGLEIGL